MPRPKFICVLCMILILNPFGTDANFIDISIGRIFEGTDGIQKSVQTISDAIPVIPSPWNILGTVRKFLSDVHNLVKGIGSATKAVDTTIGNIKHTVDYFRKCLDLREIPSPIPAGLLSHSPLPNNKELWEHLRATLNISNLLQKEDTRNVTEVIKDDGYHVETHRITTNDSYILTYYRIPCGQNKNCNETLRGPPVLIQHGFFTYSASWIAVEKKDCLPYILADAGYDVWLGNARGTFPSRLHENLTTSDPQYWNFTWEDMGTKDIPKAIDFILEETIYHQLYYIGHSMGTTMAFAGLSMRPEYSKKIKVFFALAPVAWLYRSTTLLRLAAAAEVLFQGLDFVDLIHLPDEVNPPYVNQLLDMSLSTVCNPKLLSSVVCGNLAFLICGYDFDNTNFSALSRVMGHFVSSISLKTLRHFLQGVIRDTFRRFDYGPTQNEHAYGHCIPPDYNLTAIETKTIFFYGDADHFSNEKDVKKLMGKFNPAFVKIHRINVSSWNHLDFLIAKEARKEIAVPILNYMNMTENLIE